LEFQPQPPYLYKEHPGGKKGEKISLPVHFSSRLKAMRETTVGEDVLNQANAHTQLAGKFALASQGDER
jgi:hypothetical protein